MGRSPTMVILHWTPHTQDGEQDGRRDILWLAV